MVWLPGDGSTKLASRPCYLAGTAGSVLSLCARAGVLLTHGHCGILTRVPWNRHEGQPGPAGQTWWACQLLSLPCRCIPGFSQFGLSQLSVGTFTE